MKHPVQNSPVKDPSPGSSDHQSGGAAETDPVSSGIPVSEVVWRGLEAVRLSGLTNMLDRPMVVQLAEEMGFAEAARWVREHRREYAEAVFQGFRVVRERDNV